MIDEESHHFFIEGFETWGEVEMRSGYLIAFPVIGEYDPFVNNSLNAAAPGARGAPARGAPARGAPATADAVAAAPAVTPVAVALGNGNAGGGRGGVTGSRSRRKMRKSATSKQRRLLFKPPNSFGS